MKINKLEQELVVHLHTSLQNYIRAWHKKPTDIDLDNIQIKRIRYVMDWGLKVAPEDGFIVEFGSRRELLGRSELGLNVEEFKASIGEQNQNSLLFGKDLVTNQAWYEYPVIHGELDDTFDEASDYKAGGMYAGSDYTTFKTKYE